MIFHGGYYYYSETRNKRHIYIRRSRTIVGIGQDPAFVSGARRHEVAIPTTFGPQNCT